ncbi:hypothetical protein D9758_007258 [Tetrapyrgos nigripes]|uniref:Uncharacterized protein n=1 Tax=Tetrapyrgos nigripes TaxID=182062 RepID=A0A8H5D1R7_9AGAR|nr:hypothetical protein D9758_007258 [Tetrapyrgos nigripes]
MSTRGSTVMMQKVVAEPKTMQGMSTTSTRGYPIENGNGSRSYTPDIGQERAALERIARVFSTMPVDTDRYQ